jgi:hypothetical protein
MRSRLRVNGHTFIQRTLIAVALLWTAAPLQAQSVASSTSTATPTFTKDVAPILQRSCQRCHRPGSIAPMSLLTYDDARPWARSIKRQVSTREMPPWHIDRTVGIQKFSDDPSLSAADIETIVKWVDAGVPRGNPADLPPPVRWAPDDRWSIGKPDVIVSLKKGDLSVAAAGADQWLNIPLEDPQFTEDVYVKAIEIKPTKAHRPSTMPTRVGWRTNRTDLVTIWSSSRSAKAARCIPRVAAS